MFIHRGNKNFLFPSLSLVIYVREIGKKWRSGSLRLCYVYNLKELFERVFGSFFFLNYYLYIYLKFFSFNG